VMVLLVVPAMSGCAFVSFQPASRSEIIGTWSHKDASGHTATWSFYSDGTLQMTNVPLNVTPDYVDMQSNDPYDPFSAKNISSVPLEWSKPVTALGTWTYRPHNWISMNLAAGSNFQGLAGTQMPYKFSSGHLVLFTYIGDADADDEFVFTKVPTGADQELDQHRQYRQTAQALRRQVLAHISDAMTVAGGVWTLESGQSPWTAAAGITGPRSCLESKPGPYQYSSIANGAGVSNPSSAAKAIETHWGNLGYETRMSRVDSSDQGVSVNVNLASGESLSYTVSMTASQLIATSACSYDSSMIPAVDQ
jgi:hypothetical protein